MDSLVKMSDNFYKIARQEITKVSGGVALSCFDCIPRNHFLPWIISRKEM
ncbi:MAG: hypothetical protein HYS02_01360 [Candidatus Staskawiczbacteria bacterium]|nr:hypothetical protein [Candidatus Staskawiczbacteria bacterium]